MSYPIFVTLAPIARKTQAEGAGRSPHEARPVSDSLGEGGDFTPRGPCRTLTGDAWRDRPMAGLEAGIRAAEAAGDASGARRLRRGREAEEERPAG